MKIYYSTLIAIFLISAINLPAQKIERYLEKLETPNYEKLYLHIDREFYFLGDTLWFSAYHLDGNTHNVKSGQTNLNVELVNQEGTIASKELFMLVDGTSGGYLPLSKPDIDEGSYMLRAYTDYQRNFGEDNFFEKRIKISEVNNSEELAKKKKKKLTQHTDVDLQLLPEGGFLLAGMVNKVAIKAVDETGNGVDVKGKLIDGDGNYVLTFGSVYSGMGVFFFVPKDGETYFAMLDGFPDKKVVLNDIRASAAKLTKVNTNQDYLTVSVLSNKVEEAELYHLVCMNRGEAILHVKVSEDQVNSLIKINTKNLTGGINRLVLLDKDLNPVSERLVFSSNYPLVDLKLSMNNHNFSTREKIEVAIESNDKRILNEFSRLSVSVVDENTLNSKGQTQNILSYLLLDSELNGFIESPYAYFNDEESIKSKAKLELLMLTNGWSNYVWKELEEQTFAKNYTNQNGITISGNVKKVLGKKNHKLSNVLLGAFTDNETIFLNTTTDQNGNFSFDNLILNDSVSIFVQGLNKKDKPFARLELHKPIIDSPEISKSRIAGITNFVDIPVSLHRKMYLAELALKEYYPERDSKLLPEINVVRQKKKEDDGHMRLYGRPDASLTVQDEDLTYISIIDYLRGRVPGVNVISDSLIIIRGNTSLHPEVNLNPLVLVDGVPSTFEMLTIIPMTDVDKVEVLKSGFRLAMFGSQGGNGVISILTRTGINKEPHSYPLIESAALERIKGFASAREFYSPKYTPETLNSDVPDYRTTLYWNPGVALSKGTASFDFFSSDNVGNYKIIVEGITDKGQICVGSTEFAVDSLNELLGQN